MVWTSGSRGVSSCSILGLSILGSSASAFRCVPNVRFEHLTFWLVKVGRVAFLWSGRAIGGLVVMRSSRVRFLLVIVVLALVSGWSVAGPAGVAEADDPAGRGRPDVVAEAERSAVDRARRSGQEAEVESLTSETRRVVARPDGVLEAEVSAVPVRVRRDTGWV